MIPILLTVALAADYDHSYADLDAFYEGAVHPDGVEYGTLEKRRERLSQTIAQVSSAPADSFTDDQKLALYVNAYNAYTLNLILDEEPDSIFDLDGGKVWDTRKYTVAGQALTLNQMEHEHVRKLGDARVHAVVNCAARGCPPLPPDPLRPETADAQLTAATKVWVATNAYVLRGDTIAVSQLFDWYAGDFAGYAKSDIPGVEGKEEAALAFLATYAEPSVAEKLTSGELTVTFHPYDWKLNAR